MKKIVLICLGQPSTNPRTVKEASALSKAGYEVTVIYNYSVAWADDTDKQIFAEVDKVRWILAGYHPKINKIGFFFSRLEYKLISIASNFFNNIYWMERLEARFFSPNIKATFKIKADLYIAHNLGALPIAAKAAKKFKSLYAFDAEDYHRGQLNEKSKDVRRVIALEDYYLPGVSYISSGSNLIGEQYKKHYPILNPVIINNVFSAKYIQSNTTEYTNNEYLKLFWVSQTLGINRGVETIIKAMGYLSTKKITCTFLGKASAEIRSYLSEIAKQNGVDVSKLIFIAPVALPEVFKIAATHHIGMATEPGNNLNNQFALSNKLFIYLLSGLAVVASSTPAQFSFIQQNTNIGELYKTENSIELAQILEQFISNSSKLNEYKLNALKLGEKLTWENESQKLLTVVKEVICSNER